MIYYGIYKGHHKCVWSCGFFSDEQKIVTGSLDGTVRLWDIYTGQETLRIDAHNENVNCMSVSTDNSRICTGSKDSTLKIFGTRNGRTIHTLSGHSGEVKFLSVFFF